MSTYKIILADDHAMFRGGVRKILEEKNEIEVLGEVGDGLELLDLIKKDKPDMVILDISMPNMRGIEAISEVKKIDSNIKILILTMHMDSEYLYHSRSAGAEGFLLKQDADSELFSAIDSIREGKIFVSPKMSGGNQEMQSPITRRARRDTLTVREREILKLIADGKSSREIADVLQISVRTVEHHRANLMNKLHLRSTSALVKYAISRGYTTPELQ